MSNKSAPAVEAPSQTQAPELVATHPATSMCSVPVVDRPVHRTVHREEWEPEGMPAEDGQPLNKTSPLYYVEHVGRAGVLAAALGVGAAIAGTAGIASAAPAKADSTTSSPSTKSDTKGSSGENTDNANSRNAGPTKEDSASSTSAAGGRSAAENTSTNDSRTADSRSEATDTEAAGVGTDETARDATPTSDRSTSETAKSGTSETEDTAVPAADTPGETVEVPSAPARDRAGTSTATDSVGESTADPSTERVVQIAAQPEEQSPVADADITTGATPARAVAARTVAEAAPLISTVPQAPAPVSAGEQVLNTVQVPMASPTIPASPTVQAAKTPLLWKIFPWLRPAQTPIATTTSAPVAVAEAAPLISTVPQAPAPVVAGKQVLETVQVPMASPTIPASPTVQAAKTPLLWKIFPWLRPAQTPIATTTSAPVAVASSTAATATSTAAAAVVSNSVGIKLPASATVLTVRGWSYLGSSTPDKMAKHFGGIFAAGPYKMSQVIYPAKLGKTAISAGVTALDAALMSTTGDIIVMAQSQGGQVASQWMRQYASDPIRAALAGRVTFLLTGNTLRAGSGKLIGGFVNDGSIGKATPTTTPWAIIDVARRWDGWADTPADPTNLWAAAEAKAGMVMSHSLYSQVNLYDPQNTVWQEGNTTFVLTHESKLQILNSYKYRNAPADFVAAVRAKVEAGYHRTSATLSAPVKIQSAQWQATFDSLVAKYGA